MQCLLREARSFRSVIRHAGSEQGTQAIPKFFSKPAVLATGISVFPSRDYKYGYAYLLITWIYCNIYIYKPV